jgi:hypothetical protein
MATGSLAAVAGREETAPRAPGGRLWALAAYFNPVGYARRKRNYRIFRRHLAVPLVTVELARSPSRFELARGDAEILIQHVGEDYLWQKERLLNLALQSLPPDCDRVAWLDCDLVLPGREWAGAVDVALERFPLVQAFRRFYELGPDAPPDGLSPQQAIGSGLSAGYRLVSGTPAELVFATGLGNRIKRGSTVGLAWAARRALLDRHGLYDACVVGGGDKALISAAVGRYEEVSSLEMNERQIEHYLGWARPFFADVRAQVGYVEADLYHLWHGDLRFRKHHDRQRAFRRFCFDPFVDVALDAHGCWRWNSDKPDMHAFLREYLESRREDG